MQQIFIGRQAIFDRQMQLHAYELLYREGHTHGAPPFDGDQASARTILNAFVEIGLERVAGDQRVFLNLTRSFFTKLPEIPFSKERVVLEILEDIEIDAPLLAGVAKLKAAGYTLALDDYEFSPRWSVLYPSIDIIKVEVSAIDWSTIAAQVAEIKQHNIQLLAEKVETGAEYQQLYALGFDYFQGYYFARPHVVEGTRLSENQLVMLRLLSTLNDPDVTPQQLEMLIRQDPGFSFKILRYLNSAAIGLPRKIDNIGQAVVYIGLQRLRAWTSLISLSQMEDGNQELFTMALVRAHMCSKLLETRDRNEMSNAFSVGLLSILDLLLNQPLAEVLQQMPLSSNTSEALLSHRGASGEALRCALDFEQQRGDRARFPGLDHAQILDIYLCASECAFTEQQSLLG